MTAAQPPAPNEPAPPQRGLTREERGRDVSEAQAEAEAETSTVKKYFKMMSPRYVLSMAGFSSHQVERVRRPIVVVNAP